MTNTGEKVIYKIGRLKLEDGRLVYVIKRNIDNACIDEFVVEYGELIPIIEHQLYILLQEEINDSFNSTGKEYDKATFRRLLAVMYGIMFDSSGRVLQVSTWEVLRPFYYIGRYEAMPNRLKTLSSTLTSEALEKRFETYVNQSYPSSLSDMQRQVFDKIVESFPKGTNVNELLKDCMKLICAKDYYQGKKLAKTWGEVKNTLNTSITALGLPYIQ